jgi:hypothetical protein
MRTSTGITQNEVDAYMQFATENKIITDGDVGVKNANTLCDQIIEQDSDITQQTLSLSLSRMKDQLKLKSAAQSRAETFAQKLSSNEVEAYHKWAARQARWIGLDGSDEGFENCASLLAWMRGNLVTEHTLDLALGNVINNPQFGRVHFKPARKQERSIVGGRINHALTHRDEPESNEPEVQYSHGRRNHASEVQPKPQEMKSEPAVDSWKQIVDLCMRRWTTHGQKATLEAEYNRGIATGKSWREIGASLGQIVKGWERGR